MLEAEINERLSILQEENRRSEQERQKEEEKKKISHANSLKGLEILTRMLSEHPEIGESSKFLEIYIASRVRIYKGRIEYNRSTEWIPLTPDIIKANQNEFRGHNCLDQFGERGYTPCFELVLNNLTWSRYNRTKKPQ